MHRLVSVIGWVSKFGNGSHDPIAFWQYM